MGIELTRRALLAGTVAALGCTKRTRPRDAIVLKHQPLWGDPEPFRRMLQRFERASGAAVITEQLPSTSDVVHQYFLTSLESRAADFDVFAIDVVWVAEFARAGWIADLSSAFPPDGLRRELFEGIADAAIVEGRTYAIPWYADVGVLYRRVDLAPDAPRRYDDLERAIERVRARDASIAGWLWPGKQYEGLVCNAYEAIWGHGGASTEGGRLVLDTDAARRGLAYLRGTIERGLSPRRVLSAAEEESRRAFQNGRAVFMRNWPYAWAEMQGEGSPVAGKIAISTLPTERGDPGSGALGGWFLALNARTPEHRRAGALALVKWLTSVDADLEMAVAYARTPPRVAPYDDARLRARAPFIASLAPMVRTARPRPVTPWYARLTDVLQSEMSAAVAGVRSPEEALSRAQALADRIIGGRG
jgi:multiple sugar transport system substrate-binding protein